ncbi:MAG: adenylyl-sulfate kinase [Lentisphaerae bacterium GWF2_52_8]|nr:MAG: adenylyl-sulfate kinase [Lentisphaerae bacterium GWF2_52_8]
MSISKNLFLSEGTVDREAREKRLSQRGCLLWFTGLSGSGKSSVAKELEARLHARGQLCYILDGDNLRHGLCSDLGFSDAARSENIRRAGELAALFVDAGLIVLTALISPFRAERDAVRKRVPEGRFIEIHMNASLEVCESRDPKGLYRKARAGEISDFTGISSPYETPEHPEIRIDTGSLSLDEACSRIIDFLEERQLLQKEAKTKI